MICRRASSGQHTAPIGDQAADPGPAGPTASPQSSSQQAVEVAAVRGCDGRVQTGSNPVSVSCQRAKPGGPAGGQRAAAAFACRGAVLVAVNAVGEHLGSWKVKRCHARRSPGASLGPLQAATRGYQPSANALGKPGCAARWPARLVAAVPRSSSVVDIHAPHAAAATHAPVPDATACPGHRQRSASSARRPHVSMRPPSSWFTTAPAGAARRRE